MLERMLIGAMSWAYAPCLALGAGGAWILGKPIRDGFWLSMSVLGALFIVTMTLLGILAARRRTLLWMLAASLTAEIVDLATPQRVTPTLWPVAALLVLMGTGLVKHHPFAIHRGTAG
jgi:hypothetical protein